MARTEAQRRAVALVRAATRDVIDKIDRRSGGMVGTEFRAYFHLDCTGKGPGFPKTNYMVVNGKRRPLWITHPIFVCKWSAPVCK